MSKGALIATIVAGALAAGGIATGVIIGLNNNNGGGDDGTNSSASSSVTEVKNPLGVVTRVENKDNNEFIVYYSVPINDETKEIEVHYTTEFDKTDGSYIKGEYWYLGNYAPAYSTLTVFQKGYTDMSEFSFENVSKYFGVQNFTKIANQNGSGDNIAFYTYEENGDGELKSDIRIIYYEEKKTSISTEYEYLNERKMYELENGVKPYYEDVMGFCNGRSAECQPRAKIVGDKVYYLKGQGGRSSMYCPANLVETELIFNQYWPVGTMNGDRFTDLATYPIVKVSSCNS